MNITMERTVFALPDFQETKRLEFVTFPYQTVESMRSSTVQSVNVLLGSSDKQVFVQAFAESMKSTMPPSKVVSANKGTASVQQLDCVMSALQILIQLDCSLDVSATQGTHGTLLHLDAK